MFDYLKQPDMFYKNDLKGYASDDDHDTYDDDETIMMAQCVQLLQLFKGSKQKRQPDSQDMIFQIQ